MTQRTHRIINELKRLREQAKDDAEWASTSDNCQEEWRFYRGREDAYSRAIKLLEDKREPVENSIQKVRV